MKEDFLKFTPVKCIKIAQNFVMHFTLANNHAN